MRPGEEHWSDPAYLAPVPGHEYEQVWSSDAVRREFWCQYEVRS
ncbi:hypothetical protein BH20ACT21_BH20ACT21_12310 [soil metagenome]